MRKLFFMLLAAVSLVACDKGDETPKSIELTGGTTTNQTIYADETQKSEGIKFSAKEAWTATVTAVGTKAGSDVDWLKLSQYSGGSGDFVLSLSLTENTTGADRKAEIKITCGSTIITITVEQKSTTKPDEPTLTAAFITKEGKITGGEIFGNNPPTELRWVVIRPDNENGNDDTYSKTPYPYTNKNFDITFPTPASNQLGAMFPIGSDITLTPGDAKFATGVLDYVGGYVDLTNIAWQNAVNENYQVKKGEGHVSFVFASKAVAVTGTFASKVSHEDGSGFTQTFKFNNCQFRQGWNEMVMIAAEDAAADGSMVADVTANNATKAFKWVADGGSSPNPNPDPEPKDFALHNSRTGNTIPIVSVAVDGLDEHTVFLDYYTMNSAFDRSLALTLLISKPVWNESLDEGVYTYLTPQDGADGVFAVHKSMIGDISGGKIEIRRVEGEERYEIVLEAQEKEGGLITGYSSTRLSYYPILGGSGSLSYSLDNRSTYVQCVMYEYLMGDANSFNLSFLKKWNSARSIPAFDLVVNFAKEAYSSDDLSGTYSFSANPQSGTFRAIYRGGMAGNAYFVQGGTIKIYREEKSGLYIMEVDIQTTTDREGAMNPSTITGQYEGRIVGVAR